MLLVANRPIKNSTGHFEKHTTPEFLLGNCRKIFSNIYVSSKPEKTFHFACFHLLQKWTFFGRSDSIANFNTEMNQTAKQSIVYPKALFFEADVMRHKKRVTLDA